MRFIGLDIGERRIGVAVSDELGLTAQGLETITRGVPDMSMERLVQLTTEYSAEKMIAGLPRNMNGTYGPQADIVKDYVEKLFVKVKEALPDKALELIYRDERLTTVAAHRTLLEGDVSRRKRKGVVDKIAAVMILQGYLDSRKTNEP